jgi:hypothetical protein
VLSSFLLPLLLWAQSVTCLRLASKILIGEPGGVDYFHAGMLVDKSLFNDELASMQAQQLPARGSLLTLFICPLHEVAKLFYRI